MQACWLTPQPLPDLQFKPQTFVSCSAMMGAHADLRASALLALTKLMAIEPHFCDANLRLLFTLLHNRRARMLTPFPACCIDSTMYLAGLSVVDAT